MSVRLLAALAALALFGGSTCVCNPGAAVAQSDFFAFVRPDLVENCCACLARETVFVSRDFACPDAVDAGPAGVRSPCVCGADQPACEEALSTPDAGVVVVGFCVTEGGVCEASCAGVLAYPE